MRDTVHTHIFVQAEETITKVIFCDDFTSEFKDDKVFLHFTFINKTSTDLNLIEHYQCYIHQRWGIRVLTGERKDNTLYQLNLKPEIQETQIELAHVSFDVAFNADIRCSSTIWHQRLGHIGYHTTEENDPTTIGDWPECLRES